MPTDPTLPLGPLGRVENALNRLFLKSATITQATALDANFRLLTLQGEALRGVTWTPGQKVQVSLGGWTYRTYTPVSWDPTDGSFQLLIYHHGDAPGARWGQTAKVGDPCAVFGPRESIALPTLPPVD